MLPRRSSTTQDFNQGGSVQRDVHDHPNMLGAAIFASVLGLILLILSLCAKVRGETPETGGVLLGIGLVVGGLAAFEHHKILKAMTPEERERYWSRKDAEWRATADAHARSVLGRDYDKK